MSPWFAFERRWFAALLAAMLPRSGDQRGLAELDTSRSLAELFASAPPLLMLGFRAATWILTFSPPLLAGRFALFANLDDDARDRVLVRASSSRIFVLRQLALVVKLAACFLYFADPEVRARWT